MLSDHKIEFRVYFYSKSVAFGKNIQYAQRSPRIALKNSSKMPVDHLRRSLKYHWEQYGCRIAHLNSEKHDGLT